MRLRGDNQRERLQWRCHVNLRIDNSTATSLDFAQVVDVTIGGDRPQHKSGVNTAELVCARQIIDIQFNPSSTSALSSNFGIAL